MALATVKEILAGLPRDKACAAAACNVHNMEFAQAVVWAAEDEGAPVILMIGEPMIPFAGLETLVSICRQLGAAAKVPVAIALDHGKKRENILKCIDLGVSVMFDGSHLPFEENVALTREYAALARAAGVSIEGEIGAIGGAEDDEVDHEASRTNPAQAIEFAERTGVDALAISIGNRHGFYRTPPVLDMERLAKVRAAVSMPIVLHGGSDIPEEEIRKAILGGIRKVNVGTDLKYAFFKGLKDCLDQDPMPYQPPQVLGPAREAVRRTARAKIRLFGSGRN